MIRSKEVISPNSCFNKALGNEMIFVLLARDRTAPWVVGIWCFLRVIFKLNHWTDRQIQEAWATAKTMSQTRDSIRKDVVNRRRVA